MSAKRLPETGMGEVSGKKRVFRCKVWYIVIRHQSSEVWINFLRCLPPSRASSLRPAAFKCAWQSTIKTSIDDGLERTVHGGWNEAHRITNIVRIMLANHAGRRQLTGHVGNTYRRHVSSSSARSPFTFTSYPAQTDHNSSLIYSLYLPYTTLRTAFFHMHDTITYSKVHVVFSDPLRYFL